MKGRVPSVIAACMAMSAFGIALIAGLARENPASEILLRAVISMVICYVVGLTVGLIAQYVIGLHVRQYEVAHPVPRTEPRFPQGSSGSADGADDVLVV
jgi:tetrahydromethanopterin S-methyltransferase subunit C